MKSILLVYKSNTGFTQKYAMWIKEALNCETIALEDFKSDHLEAFDIIIFGGGMHANKINGISFIKKHMDKLLSKKVIVFATGATPNEAKEQIMEFEKSNIPVNSDIPFFYFQSGMNYERMSLKEKLMMNSYKLFLHKKSNKNEVEKGVMASIETSNDHTSKTRIQPLIDYISSL